MTNFPIYVSSLGALCLLAGFASGQSVDKLQLLNVKADAVAYRGKQGIHLVEATPGETLAIVKGLEFQDGSIEAELVGTVASGAGEGARGFVGIAFRVQPNAAKYEMFYLRPTNGRADDQLRRNHSAQYVSFPDWPWERTRKETPGLYESYVDLEPAVWTKVKITVAGTKAQLYVNGATQPCLIVNDLKLGPGKGGVALWIGPGTEGYFANLRTSN
jgi:hypothetical protein